MIQYIGDISIKDAYLLATLAGNAKNILEFGCGASTQVIALYTEGIVSSIDTEESWIEKTNSNLNMFGLVDKVYFSNYYKFMSNQLFLKEPFDFVFDDGADSLRREFAIRIWPYISVGGILAFHDTRRPQDMRNVLELIAIYGNEVDKVEFNKASSNITLVHKKELEPYDNWQITEKKEPWQIGYDNPPQSFIDSLKNK